MEIRQLTYFVAVAESLSFGRAAEGLHIVQPAVSQQVRRLESELGVALFDRSSRRVRLTEAGVRLLPEARAVLAAADAVRQTAAALAARNGEPLRIGTSQGLGERLGDVLACLADRAPELDVRLVAAPHAERVAAVRTGELHAAFVRGTTAADGLELLPLWAEPLAVVLPAAHPLAAEPCLRLDQLAHLPLRLAARDANPPFHDFVVAACSAAGFRPLPGPPLTSLQDALAEIGTAAASWTLLYASAAADLTPLRRVTARPLAGPTLQTSLAVPPGPPPPPLRHLLTALPPTAAPRKGARL